MRKRMAILVIGIGAVLSSRESGQSFSKEMGAESLPKRVGRRSGGKAREPMREGDWIETEKGKRQWVRRITWGGETFPVGPMRPKQESMEFLGGRV